jgi:hypothetical protein
MNRSRSRFFQVWFVFLLMVTFLNRTWGGEPAVQIRSPKDGSHITQEQEYVLVGGRVASESANSPSIDIFLVLDVSLSTARSAGVDFPELAGLPNFYLYPRRGRFSSAVSGPLNKRESIFAAEIVASLRLLSQLNSETTRVGVITFREDAWLKQPLTHAFKDVRSALDLIYTSDPGGGGRAGGTNMASGILLGTRELLGKGESENYVDSIKAVLLLTDGIPTLPAGDARSRNRAAEDLAINAARLAGKSGIDVHVFGLGKGAVSNPRAAVGIANESGGTYIPVSRPADVLAVLDKLSVVGVDFLQVRNETIGQKALRSRLAADGFFASAVPVVEGLNRIEVLARSSDGSVGRDTITVHYQPGGNRSLDLDVFLERERNLKLQVERLGKSPDQIQREIELNPQDFRQSPTPLPSTGDPR